MGSRQQSDGNSISGAAADARHPSVIEGHQRLDRLRDEIIRLGLERNVLELELYGYTILDDVKPEPFIDELRETILKLGEEDRQAGHRIPLSGAKGNSYLVTWLLARDRIFEEAVMAEKPLALVTYLMGESCQISSNHGHIRGEGDPPQGMHTDSPMVPDPIPEAPVACNMMWVTDEFSMESGATLVVPGSHKKRHNPPPGAMKMASSSGPRCTRELHIRCIWSRSGGVCPADATMPVMPHIIAVTSVNSLSWCRRRRASSAVDIAYGRRP